VPTLGVVKALDVIERIGSGFIADPIDPAGNALGLQKLSVAALSQTLPERLIEPVTP
jgi:hypothetical protein